jgi:hypothetical protein
VKPPLQGRRDAARRLVDGVRRTVAEVIAPAARVDIAEKPRESARPTAPVSDSDARFDAARERLRTTIAPGGGDDARRQ